MSESQFNQSLPRKEMKCSVDIPDGITLQGLQQYISEFNIPQNAKLSRYMNHTIKFEWSVVK